MSARCVYGQTTQSIRSLRNTRAREIGYHKMADEIIEIADDASNDYAERENRDGENVRAFDPEHVQRARLRVEARKWLLSKALPKVYGDRLNIDAKITTQDEFAKTLEASRAAINGNAEVSH
jgi:tyrosyl-tRNA synthetase